LAVTGLTFVRTDEPGQPDKALPWLRSLQDTIPAAAAIGVAFAAAKLLTHLEARSPGALDQFLAKPTPVVKVELLPMGAASNVVAWAAPRPVRTRTAMKCVK